MQVKKRSLWEKCICLLVIGFVVSYLSVTVFAATVVTGSSWSFNLGGKEYENYSRLSYSSALFTGQTHVGSATSYSGAGYLGAKPNIYKQNSNGTYSVVAAGVWRYSTSECMGYTNATTRYSNPSDGSYVCSGQSAVYYNGGYQTYWTHVTPFIVKSPVIVNAEGVVVYED